MPKVPKTVSGRQRGAGNGTRRSKTGTRAAAGAEKTAKADGKPAAGDGKAQAKPATKRAPRRKTTKTTPAKARRVAKSSNDKAAAVDFSRRPVDAAPAATATKSTVSQLSESEQGLLADLFAVIEEHDEKGHIDREAGLGPQPLGQVIRVFGGDVLHENDRCGEIPRKSREDADEGLRSARGRPRGAGRVVRSVSDRL